MMLNYFKYLFIEFDSWR